MLPYCWGKPRAGNSCIYTRVSVQRAKAPRVEEAPLCALWLAACREQAVSAVLTGGTCSVKGKSSC